MLIHHYYPRTSNIGDHFVSVGIQNLLRHTVPGAQFESFDVNDRTGLVSGYGLDAENILKANAQADLVIVGGSNLYEAGPRWGPNRNKWGIHCDFDALKHLQPPLFLVGIGTGSRFRARAPTVPSGRVKNEIIRLNRHAAFSGVRDVLTLRWLHDLGVTGAKLMGDPATFVFNEPYERKNDGSVLVVSPNTGFVHSTGQTLRSKILGARKLARPVAWNMFFGLRHLIGKMAAEGEEVTVVCNDPRDRQFTERFLEGIPVSCVQPGTVDDYSLLLEKSKVVISGRLHTAILAFSFGIRFVLLDVDQRTHGFIETYAMQDWSLSPGIGRFTPRLASLANRLLTGDDDGWASLFQKRDDMHAAALDSLRGALESVL